MVCDFKDKNSKNSSRGLHPLKQSIWSQIEIFQLFLYIFSLTRPDIMRTTFLNPSIVIIPMAMLFSCQDKNNDDPPAYPDVRIPVEKQILDSVTGLYVSYKINNSSGILPCGSGCRIPVNCRWTALFPYRVMRCSLLRQGKITTA
jgi:hypothetical protein